MPTLIACPICYNPFTVEEAAFGKTASCPACGVRFTAKAAELVLDEGDDECEEAAEIETPAGMMVDDFLFDSSTAADLQELDAILARRFEGSRNTFWLSHGGREFPTLGLFVKNDLAYLYYVPHEANAGWCSQGLIGDLLPGEQTNFFMSRDGEELNVRNEFVIPWSDAMTAAREFFHAAEMPPSIEWFEL